MRSLRTPLSALTLVGLLFIAPSFSGCASMSNTGKGATIGAGAGGVLGAIIGRATGSTARGAVIGAAVGGTAGAVIGNQMDKQAEELDNELENANVEPILNEDGQTAGIQIVFDNAILFEVGSANLQAQAQADLTQLATSMRAYANHDAVVIGHASTDGPDDLNQRLSEQRANAVKSFLMQQGVPSARVSATGMGETQPLAGVPGTSPANRRVEIALYANPNYQEQVQEQAGGN